MNSNSNQIAQSQVVVGDREQVAARLMILKHRLEDERKTGSAVWSKNEAYLDRLGTPQELRDDLVDAKAFLARHNA